MGSFGGASEVVVEKECQCKSQTAFCLGKEEFLEFGRNECNLLEVKCFAAAAAAL